MTSAEPFGGLTFSLIRFSALKRRKLRCRIAQRSSASKSTEERLQKVIRVCCPVQFDFRRSDYSSAVSTDSRDLISFTNAATFDEFTPAVSLKVIPSIRSKISSNDGR
jgi:hypothetical protein